MPFNEKHPNFKTFLSTLSEHRAPVVFWIGAGVSADAGLPGWSKLRDILTDAALEELVSRSPEDADVLESKLSQASTTDDLWKAFEILKEILGVATYNTQIRQHLGPADTIEVPELHNLIWRLKSTRGVVSLNIDGLEGRAHQSNRVNESINAIVGRDLKNHLHTFQDKRPFIARLHGHHSDRSSWVFTKPELAVQIANVAYRTAIQALFSNFTIVFLGISADDTAAGGYIEGMNAEGLDTGNHFWITDRTDNKTRVWADEAGIMRIPYSVGSSETHTQVISSMLDQVTSHVSTDAAASPVVYPGLVSESIPDLQSLSTMGEDDVRQALSAYAKHLLDDGANRTDTTVYQEFLANYSPAIHQSSHLDTQQGYNKFFGYTAVDKIHSGPFSAVWRVKDNEHNQFALKILQLDNLRRGPQLDSFRRGISSQKLMRDSGEFDGIAKIEKAFEMPPSVIMEFVEGENLEDICQKNNFDFWKEGIEVLVNLCSQVETAHKSKFGILHRDIKPTNIMIPNYYLMESADDYGLEQFAVKLLNYDMTWHKDASGRVVPVSPSSAGFCAPELFEEPDGSRARDTRVDSYGIGMTLFRIAAGIAPPIGGSQSTEWISGISSRVSRTDKFWFKPAHKFIHRIIENATMVLPEDRCLVGDISAKLRNLRSVLVDEVSGANVEILAENLMYAICSDNYEVKRDALFERVLDGYRSYQIEACQSPDLIKVLFSNSQTDGSDWSKIDKNWSQKLNTAKEILTSGNWEVRSESNYSQRVITLVAEISATELKLDYERAEDTLKRAIAKVQID